VLGRNIARFENCTGFKDTGATEDEGQFLQDVYPVAFTLGGPGRFGFDPRAHRTEASTLLTPQNVARLKSRWHAHWEKDKTICVEKTPANILMTRFLQAAFPNSYFIVIRRHPIAVSMASQKLWKINLTSLHRLLEHWLHCHETFEEDKKYLKHVYELTYEDYIENPAKHHEEIAAFIGTRISEQPKKDNFRYVVRVSDQIHSRVPERALEEVSGAHNQKYFEHWSDFLRNSPFKSYYRYVARKYESRCNTYGYSLTKGLNLAGEALGEGQEIPTAVGRLYCLAADSYTLMWRLLIRSKEQLRLAGRAVLAGSYGGENQLAPVRERR
jgi:hypothetical protein